MTSSRWSQNPGPAATHIALQVVHATHRLGRREILRVPRPGANRVPASRTAASAPALHLPPRAPPVPSPPRSLPPSRPAASAVRPRQGESWSSTYRRSARSPAPGSRPRRRARPAHAAHQAAASLPRSCRRRPPAPTRRPASPPPKPGSTSPCGAVVAKAQSPSRSGTASTPAAAKPASSARACQSVPSVSNATRRPCPMLLPCA